MLLKKFGVNERQIHLLNLKGWRVIPNASIRDQAYSKRLYGKDDKLEDALGQLEGIAAPVFQQLRDSRRVPLPGSAERRAIQMFVSAQYLRTTAAFERSRKFGSLLTKAVFEGPAPDTWRPKEGEELRLSLGHLGTVATAMSDLRLVLVATIDARPFVLGDNPVAMYNAYREDVQGRGVLGMGCVGIQVLFPISPTLTLMLADSGVYKLGARGAEDVLHAREQDVHQMNLLQCVRAMENVYFGALGTETKLREGRHQIERLRGQAKQVAVVADAEGARESIVHTYERMPVLPMQLSFCGLRRSARGAKKSIGGDELRRPIARLIAQESGTPPPLTGGHRRFAVRRTIEE